MPERYSWAVALNATTGLITVEDGRVALGALWAPGSTNVNARSGFRPSPTEPGQVTPTPTTPDGNVRVSPFQFVMQSGRASVAGAYVMTLDAQKVINILSTPANATNNRNDLVVAQQSDTFYGDANSGMVVKQIVGTPSGTPVDPTVTGSPDYVVLARVVVRANTTSILGSDIADLRPTQKYTVALGGLIPVASQAVRDGIAAPYNGLAVWRQDKKWIEVYDGTAWLVAGGQTVGGQYRTSAPPAITTVETALVSTNAVSLDRNSLYKVTFQALGVISIATNDFDMRIRETNVTGAIVKEKVIPNNTNAYPIGDTVTHLYATTVAESKTWVGTIQRISGTGTFTPQVGTYIEVQKLGDSSLMSTV